MANRPSLFIALLSLCWLAPAQAQDAVDVSDQNCSAILASYAENPKSVARDVADACEQALLIAPGAGGNQPVAQAVDPCAEGDAGGSVQCWGPWATPLQPLAGPTPPGPEQQTPFEEPRPELLPRDEGGDDPVVPDPEFPLTPCDPGLPCGFATVVAGDSGAADAADTQFASFDLAADSTEFTVTNDDVAIQSGTDLNTEFSDRPDGLENLRAGRATIIGIITGQPSALVAQILRDADDEAVYAGDFWSHEDENGAINSGRFAWGRAVSQADIDTLIAGDATLTFNGAMSVDVNTIANIVLNYGASSDWTGSWTNPAYSFSAGGGVFGANFVSDADQFSDNVQSGFVQGGLVGSGGDLGIAHVIEVTLDGPGLVRDVGLLTSPGGTL